MTSEESTTPDVVELWRQAAEATARSDFDAAMRFFALDAVWDASQSGVGTFEGAGVTRSFLEDWLGNYDEYEMKLEESQDLGNGVVFVVARVRGRLAGSTGMVQEAWAFTSVWAAGMCVRVITSRDIDEARAAAERLADARG